MQANTKRVVLLKSKNLVKYKSENIFVTDHQNNYVEA